MTHVTVVIPCYNREATVARAIQSVLDQTHRDIDVIAVDDGSTDGTLEVLNRIEDPRLRIISNDCAKGASGARNAGARQALGDWIAFQDSDDIWLPEKLSRQIEKIENGDWVAVYCGMEIVEGMGDAKRRVGLIPSDRSMALEGDLRPGLALTSIVSTQTLMIRTDVFQAVGGFDTAFTALIDWELMLRVAEHGDVGFVDDVLVEQRLSENSITNSTEKRLNAQENILTKHHDLLGRYPKALAKHHLRIAGAHRRFGNLEKASEHLRHARQIAPFSAKSQILPIWLRARQMFDD